MSFPELQLSAKAVAEPCSAGRTGASAPAWFAGAARLLLATLREIFDESAYARFLARHEISSCPDAYTKFLLEQERTKARCPKCC
jgi:hypothetical protein